MLPAVLGEGGLDEDGDELLTRFRERALRGVLLTSSIALVPPLLIQSWQALHGVRGVVPGLALALSAFVAVVALALAPIPYRVRSTALLTIGYGFTSAAMLVEGLAPAQFVSVCMVITLCVLLHSKRTALIALGTLVLTMALSAYLYSHGYLHQNHHDYVDATNPLNWLRVGLFTVFPSTTMAVATGYLLDRLRETVALRTSLVKRLSEEVSQREHALAELERTQARLVQSQKLEAIGQLAAGIAHDFNNTLSVVALEAELLKHRGPATEDVARAADSMLAAAERGTQLSRQLLLFGRSEATERAVIDAGVVVEECVHTLKRLLPSEITLEMELAREPLPVRMLPSELQQIVLNLGINARDAMATPTREDPRAAKPGGVLTLLLDRHFLEPADAQRLGIPEGEYAVLTCRDTGSGMDEATLARVFEPFFTTKSRGRGTGLGLTNVWSIARRGAGTVDIQSKPDLGTTLSVYLRIADGPIAAVSEQRPSMLQGRETVLVVEDDIRIRALLVTLLSDAGYVVLDAANADAALALERAHSGVIDLLCTDVVMPGLPVRELIDALRQKRPRIAILVCSGYSEDEQIARGIARGELVHLAKPFTRKKLLASAREALDYARKQLS